MALTSDLFKDSKQLQDCARLDTAHIVADEPPQRQGKNDQGPHVALIHRALRRILTSPSFGLEEATETYGPKTAEVIRQFKADQSPPLLNKALGQTVPDNIVGKQTIAALDRQAGQKKQPPGGGSGGPANTQAFTVVPFNETAPFLISQQLDSRTEDDLEFTARAPRVRNRDALANVGVARALPTIALEKEMLTELSGGGQIGRDMGNIFIRTTVPLQEVPFANDSPLSKAVRASSNFAPANSKVRDEITNVFKTSIAARKVVDFNDLAAPNRVVTPPMMDKGFSFSTDRKLKFAIGGLKGVELFISKFDASVTPRRWSATLIYNFIDHFGINDSDLISDGRGHGSFGQAGMWVMQHERHPGHFAFISRIFIVIDVTDAL